MARRVKCRYCEQTDSSDLMTFELHGTVKKYYHVDGCYQKHLERQKIIDIEQAELDDLAKYIMTLHNVNTLPSSHYVMLQGLRNGEVYKRGVKAKKYKDGIPYIIIKKTYEYCSKDIKWAIANKSFTGMKGELMYGLSIVYDKINYVKKQEQKKKSQKETEELVKEQKKEIIMEQMEKEVKYKKKEDKNDISAFLD